MSENLQIAKLPEDEAIKIFRTACQQFRKKEYRKSLETLSPVLENIQEIENDKLNLLSLMWGIAGDSLACLELVNDALAAYRKSIELDANSGCVMGYVWLVSKYNISSELPFAYECFLSHENQIQSGPKRWRIFAHIFGLLTMPSTWWLLNIRSIFIRKKLEKMMQKGLWQ